MRLEEFSSIGIVGMGQIGASLALGLRHQLQVIGFDADPQAAEAAALQGIAQGASTEELLSESDLCIFAVPAGRLKSQLADLQAKRIRPRAVLADVCSTKLDIDDAVTAYSEAVGPLRYVGLHPLAGNERPGIAGAEAELFRGRTVVVSSGAAADPEASLSVAALLSSALGSQELFVNPALHDRVTNFTIQLPHIFAYLTASFSNSIDDASLLTLLSGNSFADVTRVARSRPEMVASFLYADREILLESLSKVQGRIDVLRDALRGEEDRLAAVLERFAPRTGALALEGYANTFGGLAGLEAGDVVAELERERVLVASLVAEGGRLQVSGFRPTGAGR